MYVYRADCPAKEALPLEQNRYNKLLSNTVLFAISSFSGKLLTLFIQPFLTYAMREVEEVGITKLVTAQAASAAMLTGCA